MNPRVAAVAVAVSLLAFGCASTKPVNMTEPRRVVGTENDVRVDAQISGDVLSSNTAIPITYDITNQRQQPIAVADLIPDVTYDDETQTVTVGIGSEVPGEQFLPRLVSIGPGQKKSFSCVAKVAIVRPDAAPTPLTRYPNALRLKVVFLGDTKPFAQLIGIPERAVYDPKLANELFAKWIDGNESVTTGSVPMRWRAGDSGAMSAQSRPIG